jgi:hypothetical protein
LLAIAMFGLVLTVIFNTTLDSQLAQMSAPSELVATIAAQRQKLAGIDIPASYSKAVVVSAKHAIDMSFVTGFRWVMWISAALALLSAISAGLLIEGKPGVLRDGAALQHPTSPPQSLHPDSAPASRREAPASHGLSPQ